MDLQNTRNDQGKQLNLNAPRVNRQRSSRSKLPVVGGVLLALLIVAGIVAYSVWSRTSGLVNSQYQAVFLANGQVYFGKLHNVNGSYVKISNVYYIQDASGATAQDAIAGKNIELVRLSKAVHGPKDEVVVNRDQVLYFENLDNEGQAAKLISGDKDNK